MNLYEMIAYFMIYSFFGWVVEVIYHVLKCGIVVNRGYLNGPVCPIYGFGMLAILVALSPYEENRFLLMLGGMLLSTIIELIGGYALFHFFRQRWWDYSKEPFNVGGYICVRYTIFWGIGTVLIMDMVHPLIRKLVEVFPKGIGVILMSLLGIIYLTDLFVTTKTVLKMRKEFEHLERVAASMRELSDAMTQRIGEQTMAMEERYKELHNKREEIRERLMQGKWFGSGRILNAFPHLKIRHGLHHKEKES